MKLRLLVAALIAGMAARAQAAEAPKAFDPTGSDPRAVAAVDKMFKALDMPRAWQQARYIEFGFGTSVHDTVKVSRRHAWDTRANRYRVEGDSRRLKKHYVLIFGDVTDPKTAQVWLGGERQTADSTVRQWGDLGHGIFINDTYWLLMPYKMKDPGVRLKWLGLELDTVSKADCNKLELSFDQAGLAPKDHYTVWIDTLADRVVRWNEHSGRDSTVTSDNMFYDYRKVGPLMLSERRPEPGQRDGLVLDSPIVSATVNEDKFKAP